MSSRGRQADIEEYVQATAAARAARATVADQLRELVVDADRMSGPGEVAERVQRLQHAMRQLAQAQGREEQAREQGMPVALHVEAQREWRDLLREAAMAVAVACAGWVADMDLRVGQRARLD